MSGYIKLHRNILDNELWQSEPFTRGQAWVDLLLLANHSDGWFRCRGIKVKIKRGQVGRSEGTLAKRWKWSRGKVRRFLSELESEAVQQIELQKNNVTTLITITNYEQYQGNGTANSTASDTANGQQTVQQTDINKKNKKNKKKEYIGESKPKIALPDCVSEQTWKDIKAHRSKLRSPMSSRAERIMLNALVRIHEEGINVDDAVDLMVSRGWKSVSVEYCRNAWSGGYRSRQSNREDGLVL